MYPITFRNERPILIKIDPQSIVLLCLFYLAIHHSPEIGAKDHFKEDQAAELPCVGGVFLHDGPSYLCGSVYYSMKHCNFF
jgi:hypothetical protein